MAICPVSKLLGVPKLVNNKNEIFLKKANAVLNILQAISTDVAIAIEVILDLTKDDTMKTNEQQAII